MTSKKLTLDSEKPAMSQIKIITVTSGNVDDANSKLTKGEAMVEFFHPNCGHCQTLKPEWDKMCFQLKKDYKGKATVAAVDCSDQEMLGNLHIDQNFQGFPTIFHMKDGKTVDEYQGERTKDSLLKYAEERLPITMQTHELEPAIPFMFSPSESVITHTGSVGKGSKSKKKSKKQLKSKKKTRKTAKKAGKVRTKMRNLSKKISKKFSKKKRAKKVKSRK